MGILDIWVDHQVAWGPWEDTLAIWEDIPGIWGDHQGVWEDRQVPWVAWGVHLLLWRDHRPGVVEVKESRHQRSGEKSQKMLHLHSRPHQWVILCTEVQACMALQQGMEVPMTGSWGLGGQEVT